MDLENGGLDAQIEQRMDAYRGNPQQLQQRYGQNKELLDLLALQKLTSEKKAVAADMQLKQAQQPGTIAQQREQEALELTKQEMGGTLGQLAQNTKGTLDQKQALQQKNMSKMAQNAGRPQMGGGGGLAGLMGGAARPQPRPTAPPQAQGLAAARMAQGPSKFASGGIVSFAEGQQVQSGSPFSRYVSDTYQGLKGNAAESKLRNRVQTLYGPYSAPFGGLFQQSDANRTRAKDIISRLQSGELSVSEMETLVQQYPEFRKNAAQVDARVSAAPNEMPSQLGATTGDPLSMPQGGIGALMPPSATAPATTTAPTPDLLDPRGPNQTPTAPVTVGDAVPTTGDAVPTAGETAASFQVPQTADSANTGILAAQGTTNADSAFLKGTQMADEYTGRAAASESYEGMQSRLAEFDAANYGPEDDFQAFLIGTGGTGSIGGAMKGGYNAMNRSKAQRRNRLMDEFKIEQDRIGADAVFSTSGIRLGTQLAADAADNERNMRSAAATMGAAKMRAATADADRVAKANTDTLEAAAKAVEQAQKASEGRRAAAIDVAQLTAKTRTDLITGLVAEDPMLRSINMELMAAGDDPEAAATLQNNADERVKFLNFLTDAAMDEFGLLDAEQAATELLKNALGQPKLNTDDVVKRSIEGE
jgi:hypothetical protein